MSRTVSDPLKSDTFRAIEKRLDALNPSVVLKDHIGSGLEAYLTTLEGVKFTVKDRGKLLGALRSAKDSIGQQAFAEGSKIDPKHWNREGIKGDPKNWALNMSFGKTPGIGFREIWRLRLTTRSLQMADARPPGLNLPKLDGRFAANFGDNTNVPDLSSLHLAVWDETTKGRTSTFCTAHIDDVGFVMVGPNSEIITNPDFLRHTVVELLWKTELRGVLPDWMVDNVNPVVPSSFNDYSRVGLSIDLVNTGKYKIAVSGTCGIFGGFDCSGTFNITGSHDLLGGS